MHPGRQDQLGAENGGQRNGGDVAVVLVDQAGARCVPQQQAYALVQPPLHGLPESIVSCITVHFRLRTHHSQYSAHHTFLSQRKLERGGTLRAAANAKTCGAWVPLQRAEKAGCFARCVTPRTVMILRLSTSVRPWRA